MKAVTAVGVAAFVILSACNPSDGVPGPNSTVVGEEGDRAEDAVGPDATTPPPIFGANDSVMNVAIPEPATLDPMRIGDPGSALVARQLYEGLTSWDPDLEKVRPAVAEAWRASPDGTLFLFRLREGMTFHDGTPVTSRAFAFAFDRIALKSNASDLAYLLAKVVGFDAVNGSGTATHLAGITTPDNLTLQIRLSEPYHDFPAVLTHPGLVPLSEQVLADFDTFLTAPTGNGPFRIAQEWSPGGSVLLRAYEGFIQTPELDGIRFLAYPDAAASWVDFVRGDVHVTEVPAGQVGQAAQRFGEDHFKPFLKGEYLGLNVDSPALKNLNMRKAINFGIDRAHIARAIYKGTLDVPRGIVPAGMAGFQENVCVDLCRYEPARAKRFARKIKKRDREVTLSFTKGDPAEKTARVVARDLEAIGLRVRKRGYKFPAFLKVLQSDKQETFRLGWFAEFPSPDLFLDPLFRSSSPDNHSGYRSAQVDRLLAEAHRSRSPGRRLALYIQAEKVILRSYPVIPIGSFVSRWAVQPDVTNIQFDVMGGFDAAEVDLAS